MIVPEFWAEATRSGKVKNRSVTIKRFGWSDTNQELAQALADSRADEAFAAVMAGEKLAKREPKTAYNGAEGVPIREEIISRHDDAVITRNGYGALCLNTPDVLFGDIDFAEGASFLLIGSVFLILLVIAFVLVYVIGLPQWIFLGLIITPIVSTFVSNLIRTIFPPTKKTHEKIKKFIATHPDWRIRIYRTPMGFRLLVMHKTFSPQDLQVREFFEYLGVDTLYQKMCFNQNCFRARISPKPWRIGIPNHLRPRPGVWPVSADKIPARAAWVTEYEQKAKGFASCHFFGDVGSAKVDHKAFGIQKLHDDYCKATAKLPLA